MLPQVMENYSSGANLLALVMRHNSLTGAKLRQFESGDGAPMAALFNFQRRALQKLRNQATDLGDASSTCTSASESSAGSSRTGESMYEHARM